MTTFLACSPCSPDTCVSISSLYFCPSSFSLPSKPPSQAGANLRVLTTLCDGDFEVKLRCPALAMGATRRPGTSCLMGSTSLSSITWRWVEPVTMETHWPNWILTKWRFNVTPYPLLVFPLSPITLLPPPLLPSFLLLTPSGARGTDDVKSALCSGDCSHSIVKETQADHWESSTTWHQSSEP